MKTILKMWLVACFCVGMAACSGSDDDNNNGGGELGGNADGSLVLTPSVTRITTSKYDVVEFTVTLNGKDVTKGARIKESGGDFIKNASFSKEKAGKYEFKASYDGKLSAPVMITVEQEVLFKKFLLMQEFTSIECPNCPAMTWNLDHMQGTYPGELIVMAYHGDLNSNPPDPMGYYQYIYPVSSRFNVFQTYPATALDQTRLWSNNEDLAKMDVEDFLAKPGTVGIAIETSLKGRELAIHVKVKSTEFFTEKCRLAVVMLEDKIVYPQMTNDGRTAFWEDNYEHNHVVRKYLTDVWGDLLEVGAIERGKEFKADFAYTFPDNSTIPTEVDKRKPENMEVVVYVTDSSNDYVLNSRAVKVGESVDYKMND